MKTDTQFTLSETA